jgi:hypothetical protein
MLVWRYKNIPDLQAPPLDQQQHQSRTRDAQQVRTERQYNGDAEAGFASSYAHVS